MNRRSWMVPLLGLLFPLAALGLEPAELPRAVTPATLPTAADLDESWARVLIRANPGPFQYCAYEVTARGRAGVASHVRGVMGRKDAETRTELLSFGQLAQFMGTLRDLDMLHAPHPPLPWKDPAGAAPKPAAPAKTKGKARVAAKAAVAGILAEQDALWTPETSAVPIYELSFRFAGQENTFLVADPAAQADPRYAAFIRLVRAMAIKSAGDIGFHPPSGDDGRQGYLFVDSVPGAVVTVDGAPLEGETPILAYPLAAGRHVLVLENKLHGLRKEQRVLIQPGLITSVELDLR